MNYYTMNKAELIVECRRLEAENEKLMKELDELSELYLIHEIEGDNNVFQRFCDNEKQKVCRKI